MLVLGYKHFDKSTFGNHFRSIDFMAAWKLWLENYVVLDWTQTASVV